MPITIKTTVKSNLKEIRRRLEGPPMQSLMKQTEERMVAQVQRNAATEGKPSGDFAPLSGFNANTGGTRTAQQRTERQGALVRQHQRKVGILDGRSKKDERVAAKKVSRHTGYARQKEREFEEGKLQFGPGVRWRATGGLFNSLVGRIFITSNKSWVELHADGNDSDGTPQETKLLAMCKGIPGRMPARDPTRNMKQLEDWFYGKLAKLMEGL